MLERLFHLSENGTNVRVEVMAGITTFVTMAYIIVVNPVILAGTPARPGALGPALFGATVTATCLASAVPCLLMGLWANYPVALASAMGLNTALTAVVLSGAASWQTMMGVVFVEGVIILVLVLLGLRESILKSLPLDLKRAIGAGIGLLVALLGMHQAHWVRNSADPTELLAMPAGNFHDPRTQLATFGVLLTAILIARHVRGALLIGMAAVTAIAMALGMAHPPAQLLAAPQFATFGAMDIAGALRPAMFATIFAFMVPDFFDTMGTVIAVSEQAGIMRKDGSLPRLGRVLVVDAFAALWGGLCSASSTTAYIESASGVSAGGRTGLTTVVAGLLFVAAVFLSPIVQVVPPEATAPALIIVGFLMMSAVREIDFTDTVTAIPAFIVLLVIPLTMSIARGIGMGFIALAVMCAACGRLRSTPLATWAMALVFAVTFALEHAAR